MRAEPEHPYLSGLAWSKRQTAYAEESHAGSHHIADHLSHRPSGLPVSTRSPYRAVLAARGATEDDRSW